MVSQIDNSASNKPIKIKIVDLGEKDYFYKHFDFPYEISENPDVVLHGYYSDAHQVYKKSLRICFLIENSIPNYFGYDFSMGFNFKKAGNVHLRWPFYNCGLDFDRAVAPIHNDSREKFCSLVVSNDKCAMRNNFFFALSHYKHVDSGGRAFNNVDGPVSNKHEFLLKSKFNIAFENSAYPGYVTEKIVDAKQAGCIPIYWGNPYVDVDFNPKAFINLQNFASFADCIKYIAYIDSNQDAYNAMRREPLLPDGKYTQYSDPQVLKKWLKHAVRQKPALWRTSSAFAYRATKRISQEYLMLTNLKYCSKYGIITWKK